MDDEIPMGSWSIAPEMRHAMRLDRIRTAMAATQFEDAILEAEELLDEVPQHAEALYLLGDALLELGDAELARQALESSARADDAPSVELLYRLGLAAFETCDPITALENLREVVRLQPDNADAHFTMGLLFDLRAEAGDIDLGLESFAVAQALNPDRFPPPMQLEPGDWKTALHEAIAAMPPLLAKVLDQVPITLVERPDLAELRHMTPMLPPTVIALFDGDPGLEQSGTQSDDMEEVPLAPTGARVFTRTLARYPTFDDLVLALTHALTLEAADWIGVDPTAP